MVLLVIYTWKLEIKKTFQSRTSNVGKNHYLFSIKKKQFNQIDCIVYLVIKSIYI